MDYEKQSDRRNMGRPEQFYGENNTSAAFRIENSGYRKKQRRGEKRNTGDHDDSAGVHLFSYATVIAGNCRSKRLWQFLSGFSGSRNLWSNFVGRISLTYQQSGFIITTSETDLIFIYKRLYKTNFSERFRSI